MPSNKEGMRQPVCKGIMKTKKIECGRIMDSYLVLDNQKIRGLKLLSLPTTLIY